MSKIASLIKEYADLLLQEWSWNKDFLQDFKDEKKNKNVSKIKITRSAVIEWFLSLAKDKKTVQQSILNQKIIPYVESQFRGMKTDDLELNRDRVINAMKVTLNKKFAKFIIDIKKQKNTTITISLGGEKSTIDLATGKVEQPKPPAASPSRGQQPQALSKSDMIKQIISSWRLFLRQKDQKISESDLTEDIVPYLDNYLEKNVVKEKKAFNEDTVKTIIKHLNDKFKSLLKKA
jgi:hypothetical protein